MRFALVCLERDAYKLGARLWTSLWEIANLAASLKTLIHGHLTGRFGHFCHVQSLVGAFGIHGDVSQMHLKRWERSGSGHFFFRGIEAGAYVLTLRQKRRFPPAHHDHIRCGTKSEYRKIRDREVNRIGSHRSAIARVSSRCQPIGRQVWELLDAKYDTGKAGFAVGQRHAY